MTHSVSWRLLLTLHFQDPATAKSCYPAFRKLPNTPQASGLSTHKSSNPQTLRAFKLSAYPALFPLPWLTRLKDTSLTSCATSLQAADSFRVTWTHSGDPDELNGHSLAQNRQISVRLAFRYLGKCFRALQCFQGIIIENVLMLTVTEVLVNWWKNWLGKYKIY